MADNEYRRHTTEDAMATTTRHNHGPNFGRKITGCPRCAELEAGAAPVVWDIRRSAPVAPLPQIRRHDCQVSGCGVVCTYGEW
jgi:hypothetical protein